MFNYWRTIILNQTIGYIEVKNFLDSNKSSFRYYPNTNPKHLKRCKGIVKDLNEMRKHGKLPMVHWQRHLDHNTDYSQTDWRCYEVSDMQHQFIENQNLDIRIKIPVLNTKTFVLERISLIPEDDYVIYHDDDTGEPVYRSEVMFYNSVGL